MNASKPQNIIHLVSLGSWSLQEKKNSLKAKRALVLYTFETVSKL